VGHQIPDHEQPNWALLVDEPAEIADYRVIAQLLARQWTPML
jgi:hypothetical protein